MRYPRNGRTIKIPVHNVRRQLPLVEDNARPLVAGPGAIGPDAAVEDRAELEERAETGIEAAHPADSLTSHNAELDKVRKRAARQVQLQIQEERRRLLSRILTVVDNLERALGSVNVSEPVLTDIQLVSGIQLTLDDLLRQLAQEGVEPIHALGKPFDPRYHEAVAVDGSGGDVVVKVLQTGYVLNGGLLRPARVVVGSPGLYEQTNRA